jgi:hypothetical protein
MRNTILWLNTSGARSSLRLSNNARIGAANARRWVTNGSKLQSHFFFLSPVSQKTLKNGLNVKTDRAGILTSCPLSTSLGLPLCCCSDGKYPGSVCFHIQAVLQCFLWDGRQKKEVTLQLGAFRDSLSCIGRAYPSIVREAQRAACSGSIQPKYCVAHVCVFRGKRQSSTVLLMSNRIERRHIFFLPTTTLIQLFREVLQYFFCEDVS